MQRLDELKCRRCERVLPRSEFDTCAMKSGRKRPYERCRSCRAESGWITKAGGVKATPPNPAGLCMCGCGEVTPIAKRTNRSFGHVCGFPTKYILGHGPHVTSGPRWEVNELTGCWIWLRGTSNRGTRGLVGRRNGTLRAHRVVYEQFKGPIPEGLELDHLCRNPICVNPDHLEPVTHEENMRRYHQYARENGYRIGRPPR